MKKLIAVLTLFFSSYSFAMSDSDVFVGTDPSGLKIALISEKCPLEGAEIARIAFAFYGNKIIIGCWFVMNDKVNILWVPDNSEPIRTSHDVDIFVLEKIV